MAARVLLREITTEEGNRLLRIVRRTSGSVVTWRRAQIVLLSAQGMSPPAISEVVFTDPDTVRDVSHNFNRDGFDALYPRYCGGRPQTFTVPKRQEIKRIALADPHNWIRRFVQLNVLKGFGDMRGYRRRALPPLGGHRLRFGSSRLSGGT
jgi:hypothetical protein